MGIRSLGVEYFVGADGVSMPMLLLLSLLSFVGALTARRVTRTSSIPIVYGALCTMAQADLKRLVAYSSVSHMGFTLLALGALTPQRISRSSTRVRSEASCPSRPSCWSSVYGRGRCSI